MEGENAAFYVETREPVEAPSWGRNGQELVEASHTLIRSFGKTHLLVLVHVSRHDAGVITFTAGESQTSAQLRVKCAKRIPPSAPVAARMCTSRSNAALLTWCPPPDMHRSPPSSYILERQAVGEDEWVSCLTTDVASMVEVLGDGVPHEGDYCFRVCSANQYGCSEHVEFPGSVHLVPRAHVQRGLQDVTVHTGEDATFSVQLSVTTSGCWFFNGKKLEKEEEDQQYQITHCGTDHALKIRAVQLSANGAEVRFEASGVKECAILHVQDDSALLVQSEGCIRRLLIPSVSSLDSGTYTCDAGDDSISFRVTVDEPPTRVVHSNAEDAHTYQASQRVVLTCELSRPDAPICWYKDGEKVEESSGFLFEREGPHCRLIIPSAQVHDTGEFVCDVGGDSVFFSITVTDEPHTYQALEQVTLTCELSRPNVPVHWYKDGEEVEESEGLRLESEGCHRRLVITSAQVQDTGEFVCDAGGDSVFFNITVTEPPVKVVLSNADETHVYWAGERVVLSCELSRPDAPVCWYKDGEEVEGSEGLLLESEGLLCRLIIPSAQVQDSGEFVCDAGGDSVFFNISVTEPPVKIVQSNADVAHTYQASDRVVLSCVLSCPNALVRWYKDGEEVETGEGLLLESEGPHRWLILPSAQVQDSGEFVCDTGTDSAFFVVSVAAPKVHISPVPEAQSFQTILEGMPILLECEVSATDAPVQWLKDGEPVSLGDDNLTIQSEGFLRKMLIHSACPLDSGTYTCNTADDTVNFIVTVDELPVRVVNSNADAAHVYQISERVVLTCELSRADVLVCWYKDGEELEESDGLLLESEGLHRRLVITAAQAQDTGEFVCDAGGDSVFFNVTITGE
ncbi:hypothetical protein JD844_022252 [Phrynosoma platyrhinos]|uniref:Obscurin-like protein 1 n=1 Tax=Phrynosoma platyrhinos TaxID=52577 RepID=A0ABQ7SUY0_PHRPL|nr:hypothetical protein JD844_022252 [Phrynosoma platyrhinos]